MAGNSTGLVVVLIERTIHFSANPNHGYAVGICPDDGVVSSKNSSAFQAQSKRTGDF
jgi:hypothetical protein